MSKCMMCQNDEDLREEYERAKPDVPLEELEISPETREKIKKLKSFSFYLVVTPIIILMILILVFVR